MAHVFIGVGSNIDRDNNIKSGIKVLQQVFGELQISPIYDSKAVGFDGENFYNLVVGVHTDLNPLETVKQLHEIENRFGRDRNLPRYSSRTLDLDLLLYDDLVLHDDNLQIPRADILKYAFVLKPLADIAADLTHPVTGERYADLWQVFETGDESISPVEIEFD